MIRQLTRPLLRPLTRPLVGKGGCEQWVYDFDGVDDFGQFAQRLIDPDGDIDIEFWTPTSGGIKTILYQGVGETVSQFDVWLKRNGASIELGVGGTSRSIGALEAGAFFKLNLTGTDLTARDATDNLVFSTSYTRGTYRSVDPVALVGARIAGYNYVNFYQGSMPDIKINGHYYPINNPASPEQRSVPDNGNPLTLVNAKPERWSKIKIPCPKPTQPIVSGVFTSDGLQVFTSDNLNIEVQQ